MGIKRQAEAGGEITWEEMGGIRRARNISRTRRFGRWKGSTQLSVVTSGRGASRWTAYRKHHN